MPSKRRSRSRTPDPPRARSRSPLPTPSTPTRTAKSSSSTHLAPGTASSPSTPRRRKKKTMRSVSFSLPSHPYPLASLLHPLRSTSTQWLVLPVLLMAALLFRWVVGLGGYSGFQEEPKRGDFEAQRHWMEVTRWVPVREWYTHDLEWWGLDYPPLTAYHSWVLGVIGSWIQPRWFELYKSRALDDPSLKLYMRSTVIISELITYIPGTVIFVRAFSRLSSLSKYDQNVALAAILLSPGVILIDNGHFQYNTVMLGFAALALAGFVTDHFYWGSAFFVLSISFKQMALYYAPAVAAYLAGICLFPELDLTRFTLLALSTLGTLSMMLAPLGLLGGWETIPQMVTRIFPFQRGLFEDKVANAWCVLNVVIKLREKYSNEFLRIVSLGATLASIAPTCLTLFLVPQKRLLPWALSACAWGFYMFSFQVHEKSVLLPLMPLTLTLAGGMDRETVSWVTFANVLGTFSMWPLLHRDGLTLQYAVMILFYFWIMGGWRMSNNTLARLIQAAGYAGAIAVHVGEFAYGNTERYPDLWVVGNCIVSFCAFVTCWGWVMVRMVQEARNGGQKRKTE